MQAGFSRPPEIQLFQAGDHQGNGSVGRLGQGVVAVLGYTGWRNGALEPAARHGTGAIEHVANRVGQVVIDEIDKALLLEIAVITKGDIA